jgi:transposase InsO family protein
MVEVVESLRLTHRDASIRYVYELAANYASEVGEKAPSMFQVRSICAQIPAPVRLLADGREGEFRNRYRITYPIRHDPHRIVWQVDHKAPLHVLVRDLRAPSHRTASGEVRPFLTLVVDSASRLVMTGLFSYDAPTRFTVAAAIRDAILTNERKPFGGVPDEIWIDNGKDLIARHVYQLAEGLGVKMVPGPPHEPQVRGIVERLHETLDTRLWSTLPGYVGPNSVRRNPKAKAELTVAQLDEHFQAFVERYHREVHSETGQSPLTFWQEHATPLPVDEPLLRLLDVLLREPAQRRVLKAGIKYAGQRYWHPELAVLVGDYVLIRAAPHYTAPDEIEVFFEGQWRCTAFALTSPQGQALDRQVVAAAQRRQRAHARSRIRTAHETLQSIVSSSSSSGSARRSRRQTAPELIAHVSDAADAPITSFFASSDFATSEPSALVTSLLTTSLTTSNHLPPLPPPALPTLPLPSPASLPAARSPDLFDFLVTQQSQSSQRPEQTQQNQQPGQAKQTPQIPQTPQGQEEEPKDASG